MANHCCEVICTNCGAYWCARGCREYGPPSQDRLVKFMEKHPNGGVMCDDERCRDCGSKEIAIY